MDRQAWPDRFRRGQAWQARFGWGDTTGQVWRERAGAAGRDMAGVKPDIQTCPICGQRFRPDVGGSLQQAVRDYDAVEKALRKNFVGGVADLARRFGHDPRNLAAQLHQQASSPNSQWSQHLGFNELVSEVDQHEANPANKPFHDLRPDMARIVQQTWTNERRQMSIQEAYHAALIAHPTLGAQARAQALMEERMNETSFLPKERSKRS
jgi:hypothetical protein